MHNEFFDDADYFGLEPDVCLHTTTDMAGDCLHCGQSADDEVVTAPEPVAGAGGYENLPDVKP